MIVGMGFGTGFVRVYGVQCRCPLKQAFNLESTSCSLPWNVGVSVSFLPDFLTLLGALAARLDSVRENEASNLRRRTLHPHSLPIQWPVSGLKSYITFWILKPQCLSKLLNCPYGDFKGKL